MKQTNSVMRLIKHQCPECGSNEVRTRIVQDKFEYGSGPKAITLEAPIPYRECSSCNLQYTDSEADDLRHDAVCRHLGVMTPSYIKALRKGYDLTRAQFAELTRIGEASLARWETGELIQNAANDDYLYLLSFPENLKLLEERRDPQRSLKTEEAAKPLTERFKMLDERSLKTKLQEEREFELRPAA